MASTPEQDADEQARKKAANPLTTYFSGQKPVTQTPTAPAAPQSTNTGAAAAPGYGSASNPAAQNANSPQKPNPQQASTNVGAAALPPQTAAQGQLGLPPVQAPQQQTQQPTNFTNFQRYWNANADASQRTADALGGRAAMKAGQAADALRKSQQQFGEDVAAGTVNGPQMGVDAAVDDGTGGLTGDSTRPELGGGLTSAQMAANADGVYSGPGSLGDTKGIDDTAAKALGAQQSLDALGTTGGLQASIQAQNGQGNAGTSNLSAGLANAAGRGNFDKLRAAFNPQADLDNAVTASGKQADAAKVASAKNAADWATQAGIKGDAELKDQAYQQAKAKAAADNLSDAAKAADASVPQKPYEVAYGQDTPQNRQDYMMSGVDRSDPKSVQARQEQIAAYMKAQEMTTQNQLDQTFADVNAVFSPSTLIANATGNKDQTQMAAANAYNKGGIASASGSTTQMHIPWDKAGVDGFFVWRSMTPADWNDLNQHPSRSIFGNDQLAWILTKAQKLRGAQGTQQTSSSAPIGRSQQ